MQFAPPLAVEAQIGVAPAHLLPIVGRVGGIRQGGHNVGDDKPPFVVMQGAADGLLLKNGSWGDGGILRGNFFAHGISMRNIHFKSRRWRDGGSQLQVIKKL